MKKISSVAVSIREKEADDPPIFDERNSSIKKIKKIRTEIFFKKKKKEINNIVIFFHFLCKVIAPFSSPIYSISKPLTVYCHSIHMIMEEIEKLRPLFPQPKDEMSFFHI